jgi:hypothetical protein
MQPCSHSCLTWRCCAAALPAGNVNAVSRHGGLTPLHIACERNLQPNVDALIKYRCGRPPGAQGSLHDCHCCGGN